MALGPARCSNWREGPHENVKATGQPAARAAGQREALDTTSRLEAQTVGAARNCLHWGPRNGKHNGGHSVVVAPLAMKH